MADIPANKFSALMLKVSQALRDPNTGVSAALFNAGMIAASDQELRVFGRGETTSGDTLRYLSARYKKKREKMGRQVGYKDFYLTGDLFNSMAFIEETNTRIVRGFSSAKTALIAQGVAEQIDLQKDDIWGLSKTEVDNANKEFIAGVKRIINKAIKGDKSGIRKMQNIKVKP